MREIFGRMLDSRNWPQEGARWPTAAAATLYDYFANPVWKPQR